MDKHSASYTAVQKQRTLTDLKPLIPEENEPLMPLFSDEEEEAMMARLKQHLMDEIKKGGI